MNLRSNRDRAHDAVTGIARWAVVVAVVLSPWLFGSAEPWAFLVLSILVNMAVICWLVSFLLARQTAKPDRAMMTAVAGILAVFAIQMTPLPVPWVQALSPLSAEVQTTGQQVLASVSGEDPTAPAWLTLSVSPAATRRSLYLVVAYLGVFLVLRRTLVERSQIKTVARIIVINAFLMSLFAIIQDFSETRSIYWFYRPRLGGTIFGPFTNRNHFAGYMNLAFGVTLGLLAVAASARQRQAAAAWQLRMARLSSREVNQIILLGFMAVMIGSSICLSLSRGALVSLALALSVGSVAFAFRTRRVNLKQMTTTLALLVAATVVWLGWEPVLRRLGSLTVLASDPLHNARVKATLATLRTWGAFPVAGSGFGTFAHVFPLFQVPALQVGRFLHAHNDYAELLAEGGILGAAAFLIAFLVLLRRIRRRLPRASEAAILFVGGLSVGIIATAIHSFIDFGLHKPANALLFTAVIAMVLSAISIPRRRDGPAVPVTRNYRPSLLLRGLAVAAMAGLGLLSFSAAREMQEELAFARFIQWHKIAESLEDKQRIIAATRQSAGEADIIIAARNGNPDSLTEVTIASLWRAGNRALPPELRIRLSDQAAKTAVRAVRLAPSDYEFWLWLGRAIDVQGRAHDARLCIGRAHDLAPPKMAVDE